MPWLAGCSARSSAAAACCRARTISTSPSRPARRGFRSRPRLRERFPDEMTIVLQNKFWDLEVTAQGFTVSLTFKPGAGQAGDPFLPRSRPFVDPAVDFGLQFQAAVDELETRSARGCRK